jgi:catechol 2,3-dioxygenase-like lactoylglutathione lyase family enzyme
MLSHLGINVADLAVAKNYYDQVLGQLGYEGFLASDSQCAYRPLVAAGAYLFLYQAAASGEHRRDTVGLQHLAFAVRSRDEVDAVRDVVVGLGSTVLDEPQDWPQYPPPYYAMFWLDPFGIKLEVLCTQS